MFERRKRSTGELFMILAACYLWDVLGIAVFGSKMTLS
jgi:hypothetical protein